MMENISKLPMKLVTFKRWIINMSKSMLKRLGHIPVKQVVNAAALFLILSLFTFFVVYEDNRVYKECFVEAGVEVTAQDFLKNVNDPAFFTEESDSIDITKPGDYNLAIKAGYFVHKSILHIEDSIAPKGQPVKVNLDLGEECGAEAFVTDIEDVTEIEVSYSKEPDFTRTGSQEVEILLTDLGGNRTIVNSELFISQVVSELTVEVGSEPPQLSDFVIEGEKAVFISQVQNYDYLKPADKAVSLIVDGMNYEVALHIVDTVPPEVSVQDVDSYLLLPRNPEDFIVSIEDVTEVSTRFVKEPDINLVGEQTVEISVTDAGNNEVVKQAKLTLKEDTEAPVISGVSDLNVIVGNSISYKKNVAVTDNCSEGLIFTIDNSAVNLSAAGTYPITYIARDAAGNETIASANVTVRERVYSESEVYALADAVLARIITPGMSPMEKIQAIYNYNKQHIAYISHSEKGNWLRAAYEGLADGKGDCYVYASTAKALLIRAGIVNMDIVKIPSKTSHYWNLVDIGEGWYHFDTTPRKDHPTIFMWTEAQLMEYSANHGGSHNYDHSLYPEVN